MEYEFTCPRCRRILLSHGPRNSGLSLEKHLRAVLRAHLQRRHKVTGRQLALAAERAVWRTLAPSVH